MSHNIRYYEQIESAVADCLEPEQVAEAAPYVRQIADDLEAEADRHPTLSPAAILENVLSRIRNAIAKKNGEARLEALHHLAVSPGVQRTSAESLALAIDLANGEATRPELAQRARALALRVDDLTEEVKTLEDDELKRGLMRYLADASLEIRFLLDEKPGALSLRLNRHINA